MFEKFPFILDSLVEYIASRISLNVHSINFI